MEKTITYSLLWENIATGRRYPAGVAFYSNKFDEYRLKIDCLPEGQFYLKTTGLLEGKIHYRVETVLKKQGRFLGRKPAGAGQLSKECEGEVSIELGPFTNKLILQL